MKRPPQTFLTAAGVAVAFATTLTLGGCFASPVDQLTSQLSDTLGNVEQGLEGLQNLEGLDEAKELIKDLTGGDLDIEAGATIPADFPSAIPLVQGKVESAITMTIDGQQTWTIQVLVPNATAAMEHARQQLVSAGFEEVVWSDAAQMPIGMFQNDAYMVNLSSLGGDEVDDPSVAYQVFEQKAG